MKTFSVSVFTAFGIGTLFEPCLSAVAVEDNPPYYNLNLAKLWLSSRNSYSTAKTIKMLARKALMSIPVRYGHVVAGKPRVKVSNIEKVRLRYILDN